MPVIISNAIQRVSVPEVLLVLERFVAVESHRPCRHPSSVARIVTVRKFLVATGR